LQFCDPLWLLRVRRGLKRMLWYVVGLVILVVIAAVVGTLGGATGSHLLWKLFGSLLSCLYVWEVFDFTAPEPGVASNAKSARAGTVARAAVVIGLGASGFDAVRAMLGVSPAPTVSWTVLQCVVQIVSAVGFYALAEYVKWLCIRLPDRLMVGRVDLLKIGIFIGSLLLIVLTALVQLTILASGERAFVEVFACMDVVVLVPMLIASIFYFILLIRLAGNLAAAAAAARLFWESADMPSKDKTRGNS